MKYLATSTTSTAPQATLNSLLSALRQRQVLFGAGLEPKFEFRQDLAAEDNPALYPLGPFNPQYSAVLALHEVDPTSVIADGLLTKESRSPSAMIGRTHLHREFHYRMAFSAMIGEYWRNYLTLYTAAEKAQAMLKANTSSQLSEYADVMDSDGAIEMYLCAVGDLDGSILSYGVDREVDVVAIHAMVTARLEEYVGMLDHASFEIGFMNAADSVGVGTYPGTSHDLIMMAAHDWDRLGASGLKRVLANERARERVYEQILSRIEALGVANGASADPDEFVSITEGNDTLWLPAAINNVPFTNAAAYYQELVAAIDARSDLGFGHYQGAWNWTHQFYNMGDLVLGLFDTQTVLPYAPGSLSIRIREIDTDVANQVTALDGSVSSPEGDVVHTGHVWSVNTIDPSRINLITGHTPMVTDETYTAPGLGDLSGDLPNGFLDIRFCSDITCVQMFRLLRAFDYLWSEEGEAFRLDPALAGRARRAFPKPAAVRIRASSIALSELITHSCIEGARANINASFNRKRTERDEQQGPVMAPLNVGRTPVLLAKTNGWDRVDDSVSLTVRPVVGGATVIDALPSRVTGQASAGRVAGWMASDLPVTHGLRSMTQQTVTWPRNAAGEAIHPPTFADFHAENNALNVSDWVNAVEPSLIGYGHTEHLHPIFGFMRGLGFFATRRNGHVATNLEFGNLTRGAPAPVTEVLNGVSVPIDALMPWSANVSTSYRAPTGAPPHQVWFWDPSAFQALGEANTMYSGLAKPAAVLDPSMPHAVSVPSTFVRLPDIATRGDLGHARGRVLLMSDGNLNPVLTANADAAGITGFQLLENTFAGINGIEHGNGRDHGYVMTNYYEFDPAVTTPAEGESYQDLLAAPNFTPGVNESLFSDRVGGRSAGPDAPGAAVDNTPGFARICSLIDSCRPSGMGALGWAGLQCQNGTATVPIRAASSGVNGNTGSHTLLAGAKASTAAIDLGRSLVHTVGLVIDSKGFVPDTLPMLGHLSPYAWTLNELSGGDYRGKNDVPALGNAVTFIRPQQVLNNLETPIAYQFQLGQAPVPALPADGVPWLYSGEEAHAQNILLPMRPTAGWFEVQAGVDPVVGPWRFDGATLDLLRRRRKGEVATPWMRLADSESGLYEVTYQAVELDVLIDNVLKAVPSVGEALMVGVDNDLFRRIQIAF